MPSCPSLVPLLTIGLGYLLPFLSTSAGKGCKKITQAAILPHIPRLSCDSRVLFSTLSTLPNLHTTYTVSTSISRCILRRIFCIATLFSLQARWIPETSVRHHNNSNVILVTDSSNKVMIPWNILEIFVGRIFGRILTRPETRPPYPHPSDKHKMISHYITFPL